KGSIGSAAIGTYSVTPPTPAMVASIANLIAEKFTQVGVQPYGADPFVHQEQAPDGTWVNVTSNPPNVQGHRDCNYIQSQYGGQTACPGNALYAQLVNIRQMAQAAVVNGYNQMPYIETALPKAGYPGANIAVGVTVSNRGKTTIPGGTRVSYRVMQGATAVIAQDGAGTIPSDIVPDDGGRIWNAAAPGPVQLGYKWVSNATGNTFPGANRVSLPGDVQPGQAISLQIPVTAPVYPTNYTMSLDLYKQNEFAFADKGIADNDTNTGVS